MAGLAALFDKRKRAVARAKFDAWWNGVDFDPASLPPEEPEAAPPAEEVFEEPPETQPRLLAVMRLWGEARLMPGADADDGAAYARIGLDAAKPLHVMGAGLAGPLVALASVHAGPINALEWREETREALMRGLRRAKLESRVAMQALDLDTYAPPAESIAGLLSLDEFTYAANAPRFAQQICKALSVNAAAMIECYAAEPAPELAPAFASSFAEPHLRSAENLAALFADAGLAVETNEDVSEAHVAAARQGFKRLENVLSLAVEQGLDVHVLQEIAWEAAAWKARLKAMTQKRLARRVLLVRKPAS